MNPDDVAVAIVAINGGELIGRTRLQKSAFLLEKVGMNSGLEFTYHHFGPYSAELARGCDDAEIYGRLQMTEWPGSREKPYTVFTTVEQPPNRLGDLDAGRVRGLLDLMQSRSDVVLELAATIVYLRDSGVEPIGEVKIRKPHKASPLRLDEAQRLIAAIGLAA